VKYLDITLYKCRDLSISRIRPVTPGYLRSAAAFGFRELQYQTAHVVYPAQQKVNNAILATSRRPKRGKWTVMFLVLF